MSTIEGRPSGGVPLHVHSASILYLHGCLLIPLLCV